jgi:hypothetical protein
MTMTENNLELLIKDARRRLQVCKAELHVGDRLFVRTSNSLYSIRVLDDDLYSVSGGWFDRQGLSPATTMIAGCTWGGSAIKVDIVAACGLRIEFGNRLITSAIQNIVLLTTERHN